MFELDIPLWVIFVTAAVMLIPPVFSLAGFFLLIYSSFTRFDLRFSAVLLAVLAVVVFSIFALKSSVANGLGAISFPFSVWISYMTGDPHGISVLVIAVLGLGLNFLAIFGVVTVLHKITSRFFT